MVGRGTGGPTQGSTGPRSCWGSEDTTARAARALTTCPGARAARGRRDAGRRAPAGRRGCAARRSRCWPGSAWTTSYASNRRVGRTRRSRFIGALARALRLDQDERDHVFNLAGVAPPQARHDRDVRAAEHPAADRALRRPAPRWCSVRRATSSPGTPCPCALHGDWSVLPPERRNLVRLGSSPILPRCRTRRWAGRRSSEPSPPRQTVASLRTAAGRYPADPGLAAAAERPAPRLGGVPRAVGRHRGRGVAQPHQGAAAPLAGRAESRVRHPARPGRGTSWSSSTRPPPGRARPRRSTCSG